MDRNQKPTEEQIRQIEEAAKKEIVFDEDSPKMVYMKCTVSKELPYAIEADKT